MTLAVTDDLGGLRKGKSATYENQALVADAKSAAIFESKLTFKCKFLTRQLKCDVFVNTDVDWKQIWRFDGASRQWLKQGPEEGIVFPLSSSNFDSHCPNA